MDGDGKTQSLTNELWIQRWHVYENTYMSRVFLSLNREVRFSNLLRSTVFFSTEYGSNIVLTLIINLVAYTIE